MGLFSTVLHIHKKDLESVVITLSNVLAKNGITKFSQYPAFNEDIYDEETNSNFYLITQPTGNWVTIVELNVQLENTPYLYELTEEMSRLLDTYALSFHLHDDDVLYYNLDKSGNSLDGYTSDPQYFSEEPVSNEEILSQRHTPEKFGELIPPGKTWEELNSILNEGYWTAFDTNDLDEDGLPNDENYFGWDQLDRFEKIGKYLEIYSVDEYPFANWFDHISILDVPGSYILRAER